jgi:hypothetical protein
LTAVTVIAATGTALPAPRRNRHFINGQRRDSKSGEIPDRLSLSHGVVVSQSVLGGRPEAEVAITDAGRAIHAGRRRCHFGNDRAAVMPTVADLIGTLDSEKPRQRRETGRYGLEEFLGVESLVMRVGRTRTPWVKDP